MNVHARPQFFFYIVLEEKGFTRSLCASHGAFARLCEGKEDISVIVDGAISCLQMAVWIETDVSQVAETNWHRVSVFFFFVGA
jgi:hypothetical protein